MAEDNLKPEDDKTPAPKDIEVDTAPIVEQVTKEVTEKVSAQVAEQASEQATAKVTENIIKSIRGKEPEPEDQPSWAKRGDKTPKSYEEVGEYGADIAVKRIEAKQAETAKKQEETAKQTKEADEKRTEDQNKYWTGQLKQLVEEGHIPAPAEGIQAKLDKNEQLTQKELEDPGIKARANLWAKAREAKEPNLRLVFFEHLKDTKQAGSDAPVIGSRKSVKQEGEGEYTYEDIHNTPIEDLVVEANK